MNSRIQLISRIALCICLSHPVLADDQSLSEVGFISTSEAAEAGDSFTSVLADLERRLQQVEEENRMLRERLEPASTPTPPTEPAIDDSGLPVFLQQNPPDGQAKPVTAEPKKEKKGFEKYTVRGYTQLRFNDVLDSDGRGAAHLVGDSSVGDRQSFLLRRVRLIIQGDVSEHVSLYFQPDFAASVPGSPDNAQYAQIRDMYADVHLDDLKELRFRIGQSKVPYGWENLQSSSNRLPLDRNDAMNSAVRNERDLGIFFYWTPVEVQEFFKYVNDAGLKGSGNYGLFGVGVYNGQGGSLREQNDNLHTVARITLPFEYGNRRHAEVGMQGYVGQYAVLSAPISPLGVGAAVRPSGTLEANNEQGLQDERLAWTFVAYPEPIGFQAEWTVGNGPALNAAQTAVEVQSLSGGYAMVMARRKLRKGELLPFARWNYFNGGYKSERNAPMSNIEEWELGLEWQFSKSLELATVYTLTDRTNTTALSSANTRSYQQFEGQLLRCQLQVTW
ncbi:MAG: porin [Planctomyces sp.]